MWQIRSVEAFGDGAVSRRPLTKESRVNRKLKVSEESIINETNRPLAFFSQDRRANYERNRSNEKGDASTIYKNCYLM